MRYLLVALVGELTLGIGVAQAVPGPEADPADSFDINVNELLEAPLPHDSYDTTRFLTADGWDFGDRAAYSCAWVEFFQAGNELFEVHYEMVAGYPVPIEINDRNGEEAPDPEIASLCGDGSGAAANAVHDGSDHFPHGTTLNFYKDGVQVASIDYELQEAGGCDRGYWTPGDEAGEAWLWWDEDGPTSDGHHALDCGGGSGEPTAVVRAYVQHMAPGVGVCTENSMDGDMCTGAGTPPTGATHASAVTLRLTGDITAFGFVRVPDGTAGCRGDRIVVVERRASGEWKRVGKDRTTDDGRYTMHLRPRDGSYRSRVLTATLDTGDVCERATSARRVYVG